MTTRLLLIRHGQTDANVQRRWDGRTDLPLTEKGRQQAQALAMWLVSHESIDVLYTSPLQRARQTAEPLERALGRPAIVDPELIEINFGDCEGCATSTVLEQMPHLLLPWQERYAVDAPDWRWPNGEYERAYYERCRQAAFRLSRQHRGQVVAAVSHGGFIVPLIAWKRFGILGFAEELVVGNTSVTEFRFENDDLHLVRANATPDDTAILPH